MSLTSTDLKHIRTIVREEIDVHRQETKAGLKQLETRVGTVEQNLTSHRQETKQNFQHLEIRVNKVEQDITSHRTETKAGFKKLQKNLKVSVNFLDKQDIALEKRVSRLEDHTGLPSTL